ncbi:endonuclease/exonuclease/phosphatase family protein [Bernardetia sp. OM2101]|uniref:endonuclease/exonuclease/phosphatase family protein n=1 Tax=Bernardetia sp. OM2101 TaxID=3344876 RepID=UPI0035CF30EC
MTYNILNDNPKFSSNSPKKWSNRKGNIIKLIKKHRPDLLAIQEAKINQIEDIKNDLNYLEYYGKSASKNEDFGEQTGIFFNKERFELLDKNTFWLSETPHIYSKSWGSSHHRICSYVKLRDTKNNKITLHFNTHLDHKSELARSEGITLILQKIRQLKNDDDVVILTGDFNSIPNSAVYNIIAKQSDLKDTFENPLNVKNKINYSFVGIHKKYTFQKMLLRLFYSKYLHHRLDYIFVSNKCKITSLLIDNTSTNGHYPSDHLPIVTKIE